MEYEADEIHILLQCPVYLNSRVRYLHSFNDPNNQSFKRILSNDESQQNLSLFYHASKRQNDNLNTLSDTMWSFIYNYPQTWNVGLVVWHWFNGVGGGPVLDRLIWIISFILRKTLHLFMYRYLLLCPLNYPLFCLYCIIYFFIVYITAYFDVFLYDFERAIGLSINNQLIKARMEAAFQKPFACFLCIFYSFEMYVKCTFLKHT